MFDFDKTSDCLSFVHFKNEIERQTLMANYMISSCTTKRDTLCSVKPRNQDLGPDFFQYAPPDLANLAKNI